MSHTFTCFSLSISANGLIRLTLSRLNGGSIGYFPFVDAIAPGTVIHDDKLLDHPIRSR